MLGIQSSVQRIDATGPGKARESITESPAVVGQQIHRQPVDSTAANASNNGVNREKQSLGLHGDSFITGSDVRSSVNDPNVAMIKSRSEEQPGFLSNQDISKSENDSVRPRVVQTNGSLDFSGDSAYNNPVSSSGGRQSATEDNVRGGGSVLETRATISLAQGNATREVREGESLSQIILETYGAQSEEYIKWVTRYNPQIVDPDIILPGQQIVLPTRRNNKEFQ